jgi:hypothetical protein
VITGGSRRAAGSRQGGRPDEDLPRGCRRRAAGPRRMRQHHQDRGTSAHSIRGASSEAAPSPSSSLAGPVGTSYSVTDENGNEISVTLTRLISPAQGASQFSTPQNGDRFVGAVFTIGGISGTFSDDANNDATLIGSNGQTYTQCRLA